MAPISVPGAPSGPSGVRRSPKSSQKHPQRDPKETQGRPLGAPGASQERPKVPKSAQRSPRALLGGLGRGKIEKKSVSEAKKVDFSKSAPRLGPADARSTLDLLKLLQNRPGMVHCQFPSSLGGLLRSLLVAQECFRRPRRPPRTDSDPRGSLPRGFP